MEEFDRTKRGGMASYCRECHSKLSQRWYRENTEHHKVLREKWLADPEHRARHRFLLWKYHIKSRYGLSEEQYIELAGDPPRCGICGAERIGKIRLAVDHCHGKNVVRGILCNRCNSALERIEALEDWPEKARAYLRNAKNIPME